MVMGILIYVLYCNEKTLHKSLQQYQHIFITNTCATNSLSIPLDTFLMVLSHCMYRDTNIL